MNHRARFVQRATLRRRSVRPVTYLSPRGAILRVLCALLVLVLFAQPALADRPGGVTAQTLSLPTGPASLKGLGESFSPNMATGTGSYSVPISLPPGFVAPSISLNYTGGRGKGVLGQSWSLPTLQIYRQTDKGEPNFTEEDRFSVMGPGMNDELVLVNEELRYYRLKNEGAFALFIRDVAGDSWTIRLPSGQTAYLGESLNRRRRVGGKLINGSLADRLIALVIGRSITTSPTREKPTSRASTIRCMPTWLIKTTLTLSTRIARMFLRTIPTARLVRLRSGLPLLRFATATA